MNIPVHFVALSVTTTSLFPHNSCLFVFSIFLVTTALLGGTLDVTVHEKQDDGTIKEIHKVTGGPYGGNKVNHQFEGLLDELFGAEKLYEYRKLFPIDWFRLKNDLEKKKRGLRSQPKKETRIRLPYSFVSTINGFLPSSLALYGEGEIQLRRNEYLIFGPSVMTKQFEPVLEAMKDHLDVLLSKPELSKVRVMLLVGGFAESTILQQEIMDKFKSRCRVIVPRNAAEAVVQGAVMFGQLPDRFPKGLCPQHTAVPAAEISSEVYIQRKIHS